ncbi:DMT family transporter [Filibacter tadaridae]|uniref:Putative DMT superfamily transporter inner membrane protein n=1 Tax=Filibacter tadaridae TaxID=2483811 RepID=A0A3P5WT08_9BACL|nr:DMT family transporter [Filibacter tadaridae]VDC19094.1 putative DMT superfamily transporter inner membrane protein [Filibacter tadaridae]
MKIWKIYILLTTAMLFWGFNLPLLKYMVTLIGPVTMSGFRLLLAGITVFIILAVLKLIRLPTKKEWTYIIGGAFLNVVCHHYFLNMGLVRTTGTNAGLILGTGPVLTAILVSLILRNYPSKIQWGGFVLGLFGVGSVVLAGGGLGGLALGDIFVFLAILTQVLSFLVIAKAAKTLDPRLMTAYMMVIGSIGLLLISFIQEPGEIKVFATVPPNFWYAFLASAIIGTAVGHMLYNYSVGKVGPAKAAIFINFNTMFSLIGSAIFLHEIITGKHIFGLIFIIAGVILGSGAAEELWKKQHPPKVE